MLEIMNEAQLGTDPECFLFKDGAVIGCEKVIPKDGLSTGPYVLEKIVRDGVQAELAVTPSKNPLELGSRIRSTIAVLKAHVAKFEGVVVSFTPQVEVSKKELESLSQESRTLGCALSKNVYGHFPIDVPPDYPMRSAGGHIHLGLGSPIFNRYNHEDERWRLVPILDTVLANTCVMIDRVEGQAERRKVYGRAGEFRFPKHGLEYRTLSNFWLRSYILTELVMGMAQMCVSILSESLQDGGEDLETTLMEQIDLGMVRQAIDTNDPDLAAKTWPIVRDFMDQFIENPIIPKDLMPKFETFMEMCIAKGTCEGFFPDPMTGWEKEVKVGAFTNFLKGL